MPSETRHVAQTVSPFLMRFAQARMGIDVLPGRYCPERDVWVTDSPEGLIPLIQSQEECQAIETVTRVLAEQTDQSIGGAYAGTVASTTSTSVNMERTDVRGDAMPLHLAVTLT
ncbi:hypothetical protein [Methylobacterium sp. GXS13]|jgi:hypothetical protein|uniref:hypothetical protein n=1 Tax=Methylobacterium sp. GXS13 TaxID=1730094 RepID=UPI00128EB9E4|nr:hypothetical protein [Methylobacterium sp. GXS13]